MPSLPGPLVDFLILLKNNIKARCSSNELTSLQNDFFYRSPI